MLKSTRIMPNMASKLKSCLNMKKPISEATTNSIEAIIEIAINIIPDYYYKDLEG